MLNSILLDMPIGKLTLPWKRFLGFKVKKILRCRSYENECNFLASAFSYKCSAFATYDHLYNVLYPTRISL